MCPTRPSEICCHCGSGAETRTCCHWSCRAEAHPREESKGWSCRAEAHTREESKGCSRWCRCHWGCGAETRPMGEPMECMGCRISCQWFQQAEPVARSNLVVQLGQGIPLRLPWFPPRVSVARSSHLSLTLAASAAEQKNISN